jgi:hypothetical protein
MIYFVFFSVLPFSLSLSHSLSLSKQSTGKLRWQHPKHTRASTRVFSVHPAMFLTLPTQKPLLYLCFTSRRMVRVANASIRLFVQSSKIDMNLVENSSLFLSQWRLLSFFASLWHCLHFNYDTRTYGFDSNFISLLVRIHLKPVCRTGFLSTASVEWKFRLVCVCFSSVGAPSSSHFFPPVILLFVRINFEKPRNGLSIHFSSTLSLSLSSSL